MGCGGGGAYKRLSKEVSTQFLEQQNSREVLDAYLKKGNCTETGSM